MYLYHFYGAMLCFSLGKVTHLTLQQKRVAFQQPRTPRLTRSINPDEVVAYGAAIPAASLSTHGTLGFENKNDEVKS